MSVSKTEKMEEQQLFEKSLKRVSQSLDLEPFAQQEASWEALEAWLTERVAYLLDRETERLFQALYRIDVSEQLVHEIMSGTPSDIARNLARAIIEREKQKVITRAKYR